MVRAERRRGKEVFLSERYRDERKRTIEEKTISERPPLRGGLGGLGFP